jgi:hypothetical protein
MNGVIVALLLIAAPPEELPPPPIAGEVTTKRGREHGDRQPDQIPESTRRDLPPRALAPPPIPINPAWPAWKQERVVRAYYRAQDRWARIEAKRRAIYEARQTGDFRAVRSHREQQSRPVEYR